jgi:hypothetical protein
MTVGEAFEGTCAVRYTVTGVATETRRANGYDHGARVTEPA